MPAPSTEGGKYHCPVGEISSAALSRRLSIQLKPGIRWATGDAMLSSADVSRRLLAMANPSSLDFRIDWADCLEAVSLRGVYGVEVELRRPHVRPEAMLQMVLTPRGAAEKSGESPPANGPFVVQSSSPQENVFAANEQYFAAEAGQPKVLVERRYDSVAQAVVALKQGEIQVLDRVNPWPWPSLRAEKQLVVQPYALPLVHCLIPNVRRPLMSDRDFRRALAFGIHRQAILQQMLGGAKIPGCADHQQPLPVGVGAERSDGLRYGREHRAAALRAASGRGAGLRGDGNVLEDRTRSFRPRAQNRAEAGSCLSARRDRPAGMRLDPETTEVVGIPVELRVLEGPLPAKSPTTSI